MTCWTHVANVAKIVYAWGHFWLFVQCSTLKLGLSSHCNPHPPPHIISFNFNFFVISVSWWQQSNYKLPTTHHNMSPTPYHLPSQFTAAVQSCNEAVINVLNNGGSLMDIMKEKRPILVCPFFLHSIHFFTQLYRTAFLQPGEQKLWIPAPSILLCFYLPLLGTTFMPLDTISQSTTCSKLPWSRRSTYSGSRTSKSVSNPWHHHQRTQVVIPQRGQVMEGPNTVLSQTLAHLLWTHVHNHLKAQTLVQGLKG